LVADEGVTIPQSLCETIFTPYFTTKSRGSGLGLSVVRRLVEAHGGRVSVKPNQPRGTVFSVFLPEENIQGNT
jgi:signal transduction histidine kinase